jgi:hypothetical protein
MAKTTRGQVGDGGRKKAAPRSAAEWAGEVSAWKRSGSTAREYAQGRGISAATLAGWSSRRGAGRVGSVVAISPPSPPTNARAGGRGFLPVHVMTPVEDAPRVETEIVLLGGRRVRVVGALTLAQLAQLLQVVEGGGAC